MANDFDGLIKLAYAIVTACCEDYREAYSKGNINDLTKCRVFLLSGKVEIYTLYNFYGKEILETMDAELKKKYGSFEERRKLKASLYKTKIDNKKQELEDTRAEIKALAGNTVIKPEEKNRLLIVLRNRRYRLIGELNRLKKEAKE